MKSSHSRKKHKPAPITRVMPEESERDSYLPLDMVRVVVEAACLAADALWTNLLPRIPCSLEDLIPLREATRTAIVLSTQVASWIKHSDTRHHIDLMHWRLVQSASWTLCFRDPAWDTSLIGHVDELTGRPFLPADRDTQRKTRLEAQRIQDLEMLACIQLADSPADWIGIQGCGMAAWTHMLVELRMAIKELLPHLPLIVCCHPQSVRPLFGLPFDGKGFWDVRQIMGLGERVPARALMLFDDWREPTGENSSFHSPFGKENQCVIRLSRT